MDITGVYETPVPSSNLGESANEFATFGYRLGRCPFKAERGVRFPYVAPNTKANIVGYNKYII